MKVDFSERTELSNFHFDKAHLLYYEQKKYKKALKHFKISAKLDSKGESLFNIGRMYERGHGVQPNGEKAKKYYEQACKKSISKAMVNLSSMYLSGKLVEKNPTFSISLLKDAYALNDSFAAYNLGLIHAEGVVIDKDIEKTIQYMEHGVKEKHTKSYNFLACFYLEGKEVPQDLQRGIDYFHESAALNDSEAIYNLGLLNLQSKVLPFFDFSELNSMKYFEKGTILKNPLCSKMLAKMYTNGLIIKRNLKNGLYYYKLTEKYYYESETYKLPNDFYDVLKNVFLEIFQETLFKHQSYKDVTINFRI
eukprot:gene12120-5611_t